MEKQLQYINSLDFLMQKVTWVIKPDNIHNTSWYNLNDAWVGIFPKSTGNADWNVYYYIKSKSGQQTFTVKTNGMRGPWQVRIYRDGTDGNLGGFVDFIVNGESECPVSLTVDKKIVQDGDTVTLTWKTTLDTQSTWICLYPKSTPSVYSVDPFECDYIDSKTYVVKTMGGVGTYEFRYFHSLDSYQAITKVPIEVSCDQCVKLYTSASRIRDGKTLRIMWDSSKLKYDSQRDFALKKIMLYPRDLPCLPDNYSGMTWELDKTENGSIDVKVETQQYPCGEWEIRYFQDRHCMIPLVVLPLFIMGVDHIFVEKMMSCFKFSDINIVTVA
jgi:hypothetical protein